MGVPYVNLLMVLPILDGVPVLAWLMSSYNGCGDGGGG